MRQRGYDPLNETVFNVIAVLAVAIVAILLTTLAWFALTYLAKPSLAQEHHDRHHAFYQGWVSKAGKGCCNDRDCGGLSERDERETGGVLEVRIEGQWCPVLPQHYLKTGNVPNASVAHVCVTKGPADPCERFICYQPMPRG